MSGSTLSAKVFVVATNATIAKDHTHANQKYICFLGNSYYFFGTAINKTSNKQQIKGALI